MKSFLFNPVNGVLEPATYSEIHDFTGMSISAISKAKKNRTKIKCLNGLYIVDDSFTKKELNELRYAFNDINEVWVTVKGYPKYKVSNLGRVKSMYKSERILSLYVKRCYYLYVKLCNEDGVKEVCVHRLVAEHFLDKVEGKNIIYHKDGNVRNNDCNNLKWISREELGKLSGKLSSGIAVIKIDRYTGEELDGYDSMGEAGRENFIHRETIRLAVSGKLKTAANFVWKVDEEFNRKKNKRKAIRKERDKK